MRFSIDIEDARPILRLPMSPATAQRPVDTAAAAPCRQALSLVPRALSLGSRTAMRARVLRASAAAKRVAVDVPAGVDLQGVLQR